MTTVVNSYAVSTEGGELAPHKLERREVGKDDIVIDILYAGVCHSDLHMADGTWGHPPLPLVTGHEIVGTVSKLGSEANAHKLGDVVGVGCIVDSCGSCRFCKMDYEQICAEVPIQTYGSPERRWPGHFTAGGYSERIVVPEHFALTIPKALQEPKLLRGVAPILCAGITTYFPMRDFKIGKGSKVAIAGLGGLGHMGVRIGRALGAEVTVVSRSHAKDELAKELGAVGVISSSSEEEMQANGFKFDLVIDTIPYEHDVNQYLQLVAPLGGLRIVGHIGTFTEKPFNSIGLVYGNRSFSGSAVGGIGMTQELLELCAEHKIVSDYKMIKMEEANDVWLKLRDGKASIPRYVIDIEEFRKANAGKA